LPENWYIPSSATATLIVGLTKGEIGSFRVNPAAQEGEIIGPADSPLAIGVRNVGSISGSISLRIRDRDNGTIWTGSITLAVDEFGWVYPAPAYPMPAHDLRLRAEAYHDTIIDSFLNATIMVIVRVDTEMTLTLEPASVELGAIYSYKGRLTRVDTDAGIAGMNITTRRYEAEQWIDVGSGTTDANGNYDISVSAPTTPNGYNCMAIFPGVVPFASSSAITELTVGVIPFPVTLATLSLVIGIGLRLVGRVLG